MKFYSLNLKYSRITDIIAITELARKIEFLNEYKTISHIFRSDNRITGIFGSYAKGIEKKDSDLDIFIIGTPKKNDYDKLGKTFDMKISIKYFTLTEFISLLKQENLLTSEIIKNHILLFKIEEFIETVWKYHHGFN